MLNLRCRAVLSIAVAVVATTALVGCTDDDDTAEGTEGETIEVTHALGTTEVPVDPTRIVALGPAELDAALALGAPVVGAASNGTDAGIAPWTEALEGADDVTLLTVEGDALTVDLEEVAALDPDLILAPTYYDVDAGYDQLSQIAPTVAYQEGPVLDTWQQVTAQVGEALGREDQAAELVAEVDEALAAAAEEHPELDGATYTFGYAQPTNVSVLRDPDDVMMLVPTSLGMTLSPAVLALPEGESFAVDVSFEQLDVLDADVLALYGGADPTVQSALEASPLYTSLPVVTRGAVVEYDDDTFMAVRQPTSASIPWVIETVVPRYAAAVAAQG